MDLETALLLFIQRHSLGDFASPDFFPELIGQVFRQILVLLPVRSFFKFPYRTLDIHSIASQAVSGVCPPTDSSAIAPITHSVGRIKDYEKKVIKKARRFARPYRITDGKKFKLKSLDPGDTMGLQSEDKMCAKDALQLGVSSLAELQHMLCAQDKWAVLSDLSGHGRGWEGRRDQACHVGCEPVGTHTAAVWADTHRVVLSR
jgi:hypothetical protein